METVNVNRLKFKNFMNKIMDSTWYKILSYSVAILYFVMGVSMLIIGIKFFSLAPEIVKEMTAFDVMVNLFTIFVIGLGLIVMLTGLILVYLEGLFWKVHKLEKHINNL